MKKTYLLNNMYYFEYENRHHLEVDFKITTNFKYTNLYFTLCLCWNLLNWGKLRPAYDGHYITFSYLKCVKYKNDYVKRVYLLMF